MSGLIADLFARRIVAGIVVSAITLILVGGVVLTMTSAGCGPAKALHIKSIENHCALLAAETSPVPFSSGKPTFSNAPTPYQEPASNPFPVNPPPLSNPYPPYNPGASAGNPYTGPASGSYPPFFPSSSGAPAQTYAMNCSLPVYAGGPGSGGFITFPGGNFIADPRSGVVLPSPSPGSPSPPPPGYGQPQFQNGLSYDRAHSRWLPVQSSWVTPDGSRYAYLSPDSIYVQNVADTGQIELGVGHAWAIVSVVANGVYATNPTVAGLWFLPFTGAAKQVIAGGYWQAAAGGFAYGTVTSAVPQGAANTIIRLDLNTGSQVDYFTRPSSQSSVVAFDTKGSPIIQAYTPNGTEIWLATGPNVSAVLVVSTQGFNPNGTPFADSHGIWFPGYANYSGADIALFVAGQGLFSMASLGAQIAGACA
ncbi:MAG TPA: hypothetical protein VGU71_18645 [Candidatus Dormibacteraeota bacterium]|nr:hypothetical protein [Candidatus Dormibacteraeota bacterium]